MKRNEALVPLSRDHHDGLILAQLLKKSVPDYKDLPSAPADKAAYAVSIFHTKLKPHFCKEEELLKKLVTGNKNILDITSEIVDEHKELEKAFLSLPAAANLVEAMDALGHQLYRHIRKEERWLFPLLEEHCHEQLAAML